MNAAVDTMTPTRSAHDEAWYSARASRGVQALKAYDPGHDLVALRRQFGIAQLVELGSNENSYGPSPAARGAVLDCLHELHRYPDPLGADLKRALARLHGVGENELLLGNGSHELLMMIAQVFAGPGSEVVYPRYGFAVFALATQAAGATARVAACPTSWKYRHCIRHWRQRCSAASASTMPCAWNNCRIPTR